MVEAHSVRDEENLPCTIAFCLRARVRVSYYDVPRSTSVAVL